MVLRIWALFLLNKLVQYFLLIHLIFLVLKVGVDLDRGVGLVMWLNKSITFC